MNYYDPKTNRFPYPMDTDKHYLEVKKNNGLVFDKDYPYIDKSRKFKFEYGFVRFLLYILVFLLARIRLNLQVKGKKNLKKYKDVINKGVISVCNHVHMWDYIGIMSAVKPHRTKILAWAPNIRGENGWLIRHVGGIPIPEGDLKATVRCVNSIKDYINDGGWLHVYAEGSMWEFYAPIRPFKQGASYYACKTGRPIIPLAYSYRKNGWIRRKIFNSPASFTLNIGEPIYPDMSLPLKEAQEKLTIESHEAVCRLAGIDPKENIYKPVFDNDKRVDYYTTEYGIGYKKSW